MEGEIIWGPRLFKKGGKNNSGPGINLGLPYITKGNNTKTGNRILKGFASPQKPL